MITKLIQTRAYLLVLFLLLFHNCFAQRYSCKTHEIKPSEITEKIPAYKLQEDIDEFINILEEVHVNPYMKITKDKFYQTADSLKRSITNSLTRQQFYQAFTPLVDLLNDSHTGVEFPRGIWMHYQYEENGLFLPMLFKITRDKRIFIKHDFSKNNIPDNTEILSINSMKSKDIINTFLKYEHSPIETSSIKRLENKFVDYLWWILDFRGPFEVKTNIATYHVEGQIWDMYYKKSELFNKRNNLSNENIVLSEVDTSTCILHINSFDVPISEFKIQIEEKFKSIQKKAYQNLIIDVRNNGGGDDDNGKIVIDFITDKPYSIGLASKFMMKRSKIYDKSIKCKFPLFIRWMVNLRTVSWINKQNRLLLTHLRKIPYGENLEVQLPFQEPSNNPYRFKGNVYVLSNFNSYSATTVFVGAVKDYGLGKIIGTETGDCPTGFGNNLYFELKNSRLRCHSSTTFLIRPSGDIDMTHGVIPDYYVEQSIQDTEKNKDSVLSFTLDLIEKTKHNTLYK